MLMKQPPGPLLIQGLMESTDNPEEGNIVEALQPTNYKKADIEEVARSCRNRSIHQQNKLLLVLKSNQSPFAGKPGEWKGRPVMINLIEGAQPIWAKPYPVPLKNREVFK